MDCLTYYPRLDNPEYYLVDADGDIDEDRNDSKIACTELNILKRLEREELFLHGLAYMVDHPQRELSSHVKRDRANAYGGYAVVRGLDPVACGSVGDILAFAKEDPMTGCIEQIALTRVDGTKVLPNIWYGVDLTERTVYEFV